MSVQRESPPLRPAPPPPDLTDDEVDLGRYWASVAARWWLPLLGLVVGAIIGYLVAVGGGSTYQAQAVVSLGTPLAVGGGILPSVQTNASAVRQIVLAASTKERVARDAGLKTTARSKRNSAVVGAFLGLLLGIAAALLWEPLAGRFARRPAL